MDSNKRMDTGAKVDLSIVIPSFNTKDLIISCIKSLVKNTRGINHEIIIVDNGSSDGSVSALRNLSNSKLQIIENSKNLGFAAGNNQGWKKALGKYVLFLNSDTLITSNVLGEMVDWMDKNGRVGIASCMLKFKDGSIQPTGGYFPTLLSVLSWMTIQDVPFVDALIKPFHPMHIKSFFAKGESFYKKEKELDWVTGAFILTRKKILEEVSGWDEDYFMYVEEVDLCFRVKSAGRQIKYLPQWSIIHYGGASGTKELSVIGEFNGLKRFYKKFYPSWQYPLLRLTLKIGALGRIVLFGILEGRETAKIYAKAFTTI